jgi:serine protease AprX
LAWFISMSLGTSGSSDGTDTVSQAVNRAADAGIVPVIAAGNSGPAAYTIGAPGAAEKAITMGAA